MHERDGLFEAGEGSCGVVMGGLAPKTEQRDRDHGRASDPAGMTECDLSTATRPLVVTGEISQDAGGAVERWPGEGVVACDRLDRLDGFSDQLTGAGQVAARGLDDREHDVRECDFGVPDWHPVTDRLGRKRSCRVVVTATASAFGCGGEDRPAVRGRGIARRVRQRVRPTLRHRTSDAAS